MNQQALLNALNDAHYLYQRQIANAYADCARAKRKARRAFRDERGDIMRVRDAHAATACQMADYRISRLPARRQAEHAEIMQTLDAELTRIAASAEAAMALAGTLADAAISGAQRRYEDMLIMRRSEFNMALLDAIADSYEQSPSTPDTPDSGDSHAVPGDTP